MYPWILIALFLGLLVFVGAGVFFFVLVRNARAAQGPTMAGKYPPGYWTGIGMAIGLPMGYLPALLIGILTENATTFIAIGPALGCGLGVAIGAALEQRHKDEIRPLTEGEQRLRKWATSIGLLLALLGVLVLIGIVLLVAR